jgi:hypothetical protein
MDRRLNKPLTIVLVVGALALGLVVGIATGVADRIFGGPKPETIATASLESMRAQNRLTVFAARYVAVVTTKQQRLGGLMSAERTLILPGDVRYEVDMAKLQPTDVSWDASTSTLSVRLPEVDVAGPDININAVREYGGGGVLSALTDSNRQLDQVNRARAVQDLRKQATGAVPMQLARQSARTAVERSFAMPLRAAGFKDVKVVVRFPTDGRNDASYLDLSTPYEDAIKEAERRRAAEGR